MTIDEKDLSQLNEIDMECSVCDDDDSFGSIDIKVPKNTKINIESDTVTSDYNPHTGVTINLNDDEDARPMRHISAELTDKGIDVKKDFQSEIDQEMTGYNEIDMETEYYDDTEDDDYFTKPARNDIDIQFEEHTNSEDFKPSRSKTILDFDDASDELLVGLIDEDMIQEKKQITQGEVEADYWKNLQKKHAATNKKGAYNTHFHMSGNPKAEAEMFNMDAKPQGPIPNITNITDSGNAAGFVSSAAASGEAVGGEGGCCESLENNSYNKLLEELCAIIGFELLPNSDGSINAFDLCDDNNDYTGADINDLMTQLKPYIDDCLICPLEAQTNNSFEHYSDWCDWYDDNMKKQYPKCARDIEYCDLLAHHLQECIV